MKKLHYFTNTNPINYDEVTMDNSRHLRYSDYKHLKNVDWGIDNQIIISDIIGLCGVIIAVLSIITILYIGV